MRCGVSLLGVVLLVAGCGAKTGLGVGAPPPANADGGLDAASPPDATLPLADMCVDLPYLEPPHQAEVSFLARIDTADVLFLIDTTGSMSDEIRQIQHTLRESLVPEMARQIPDVHFSVASLADFPLGGYGDPSDQPYRLMQASTGDVSAVQRAIDRLPDSNGSDGPEAQVEALYQSATGLGRGPFIPPARCPAGTVGYPCFRATGARIFLLFTDASFHNGPGGTNPYDPSTLHTTPASYEDTVNALRDIGAKVLGLFSGGGDVEALGDLRDVARDTGAVSPGGQPIVIDIGTRGELLDTGVVEAVRTLVEDVPIDIDVLTEDWEGDHFDATAFVDHVETVRAVPADGATDEGDRFAAVHPGTRVTFRVVLKNDVVAPTEEPQVFDLRVVLRGDGVTRLSETLVEIVVPGHRGGSCAELAPGVPSF